MKRDATERPIVRGANRHSDKLSVNGKEAKAVSANFAEWEITLDRPRVSGPVEAHAEDAARNVEKRGMS